MIRALAIIAALATPALAQTPDDKARAEAIYADGQQLYAVANYSAAADRFKAAYELDPDPAYLFNIAQALRLLHRCTEAASYYHRFLAQVSSAPNLDKVHTYLDEVEACASKQLPATPPPRPVEHRLRLRPIGIGVGATGIALLGLAAGYVWHIHSLEEDRESLCNTSCTWNAELNGRANALQVKGDHASTIAIVSTTVGVAALATSAILYWLGAPTEHLAVSPQANGAAITTRFAF